MLSNATRPAKISQVFKLINDPLPSLVSVLEITPGSTSEQQNLGHDSASGSGLFLSLRLSYVLAPLREIRLAQVIFHAKAQTKTEGAKKNSDSGALASKRKA